jgi:hypothetical protein
MEMASSVIKIIKVLAKKIAACKLEFGHTSLTKYVYCGIGLT